MNSQGGAACLPGGREGVGGGGGADRDLRGPEGEGGPSAWPPLDLTAALRPTALGPHGDVAAVQVGVAACVEPPATCEKHHYRGDRLPFRHNATSTLTSNCCSGDNFCMVGVGVLF